MFEELVMQYSKIGFSVHSEVYMQPLPRNCQVFLDEVGEER